MKSIKTKIISLSAAGSLTCLAYPLLAQETGQAYLGFDVGLALQQDLTVQDTGGGKLSFDPGVRLDLGGGVHLSPSWKLGLELGIIYNSVSSIGGQTGGFGGVDYLQMPIMANVIYTLPLKGPVSAYAGVGVGGVYEVLATDWFGSEESFSFGYQGMLGVKYALSETVDLGLAYRLLGTIEHDLGDATVDGTFSHSIVAAFTFKF